MTGEYLTKRRYTRMVQEIENPTTTFPEGADSPGGPFDRIYPASQNHREYRFGPFVGATWNRGAWVRVFGFGLHVENRRGLIQPFSERYGATHPLYIWHWRIKVLKP